MSNQPLIIERSFNAPIAKVWKALTNAEEMKKWYFDIPEFIPEPGIEFQFLAGDDKKKWLHLCKVMEVIEGKKISYSWRYDGYEGNSLVSFEMFEEGDKTSLVLTHEGLETFPASNSGFAKENFVKGWNYFINSALPGYLDSGK